MSESAHVQPLVFRYIVGWLFINARKSFGLKLLERIQDQGSADIYSANVAGICGYAGHHSPQQIVKVETILTLSLLSSESGSQACFSLLLLLFQHASAHSRELLLLLLITVSP